MARALVILAEGAEEMETVIPVDVLRRGGVEVVLAGLDGAAPVRCSRGVTIVPDVGLDEVAGTFDVVVLPGGLGGAQRLAASDRVGRILTDQVAAGRLVGAICAAPIALVRHDVLGGVPTSAHVSVHDVVRPHAPIAQGVSDTPSLVSAPGPRAGFDFAIALLRRLCGPEVVDEVVAPMAFVADRGTGAQDG